MMRPPILTPRSVGDALVVLGRGFTRSTFYSDISKRIPLSIAHISISSQGRRRNPEMRAMPGSAP